MSSYIYIYRCFRTYVYPIIVLKNTHLTNSIVSYQVGGSELKFINNPAGWGAIKEHFIMQLTKLQNKPYNIVADFGGYVGDTALNWIINYNVKNVLIFEPQPSLIKLIHENLQTYNSIIKRKGVKVIVYPEAIGVKSGKLNLFMREGAELGDAGISYVETKNSKQIKVNIHPYHQLSDIMFDYIKMDIEGGEWDIIKERNLKNLPLNFKEMMLEMHFYKQSFDEERNIKENFLELLTAHGYNFHEFGEISYDKLYNSFGINEADPKLPVNLYIYIKNENRYSLKSILRR